MDLNKIIQKTDDFVLVDMGEVYSIFNYKESTTIMLYNKEDYNFVINEMKKRKVRIITQDVYLKDFYK